MQTLKLAIFYFVVLSHFLVVIINVSAFFILPFSWLILHIPFWYTVFLITPIDSLIIYLTFDKNPCPMTRLENVLRQSLGMKKIGGFVGHYLLRKKRTSL